MHSRHQVSPGSPGSTYLPLAASAPFAPPYSNLSSTRATRPPQRSTRARVLGRTTVREAPCCVGTPARSRTEYLPNTLGRTLADPGAKEQLTEHIVGAKQKGRHLVRFNLKHMK